MATKQYKGFHPYEHQKAVIDELRDAKGTGKVVVCKSSRQKGKSYLVGGLLLYYAINYADTKNYCLSPSFKQAKLIYETILKAIIKSGVVKTKNKTDLIITLINGSVIKFLSAEQREQLRGYTADFMCIDEAAFIPDSIFHLVLPFVDAKRAPLLLVSSPFIKQGFFYQYFCYGLENSHNTVTIDWSEEKFKESIEEILPPDRLEEYRQILPTRVFQSEYLGEWLDEDGAVFIGLKNCIKKVQIQKDDKLYVGLDWSNQGENDWTCISMFNDRGEQCLLKYWNNLTPLKQIDVIAKEIEPYLKQIAVIYSESNSIGTPYSDLLKSKSQVLEQKVQLFNTSNTSKNTAVLNMQTALENNEVTLLDDEKQTREFSYFTANYNPITRNVSYAAPQGLNDDTVMASLMAFQAYKDGSVLGNYDISISKNKFGDKARKREANRFGMSISYIGK